MPNGPTHISDIFSNIPSQYPPLNQRSSLPPRHPSLTSSPHNCGYDPIWANGYRNYLGKISSNIFPDMGSLVRDIQAVFPSRPGGLARAPDRTGRPSVVRPGRPKAGRRQWAGRHSRVRHVSSGQGTVEDCRGVLKTVGGGGGLLGTVEFLVIIFHYPQTTAPLHVFLFHIIPSFGLYFMWW